MGAWLTSSVTPPVVFCHLCSLSRESKCGRQVFSQHMILKIAAVAGRKRPRNFETETAYLRFLRFDLVESGVAPKCDHLQDITALPRRTGAHQLECLRA